MHHATPPGGPSRRLDYGLAVELGGPDRVKAHEIIHDLRNALGLVINYANLMASELADRPDVLEDLMEIKTAGRRAADLVGELSTVIATGERGAGSQ
jgi:signal transduction histidine kinase